MWCIWKEAFDLARNGAWRLINGVLIQGLGFSRGKNSSIGGV